MQWLFLVFVALVVLFVVTRSILARRRGDIPPDPFKNCEWAHRCAHADGMLCPGDGNTCETAMAFKKDAEAESQERG